MCQCTTAIDADPSHPGHVCTESVTSSKSDAILPGSSTSVAVTDRGGMPVSTENATESMLTAVHSTHTKMPSANTPFSSMGERMPVSPNTSLMTLASTPFSSMMTVSPRTSSMPLASTQFSSMMPVSPRNSSMPLASTQFSSMMPVSPRNSSMPLASTQFSSMMPVSPRNSSMPSASTQFSSMMPVSPRNSSMPSASTQFSSVMPVSPRNSSMPSASTQFSSMMPVSPRNSSITTNKRTTESNISAQPQQSAPPLTSVPSSDAAHLNLSEAQLQNITKSPHIFNTSHIMREDPAANTSAFLQEITHSYSTASPDKVNSSWNQPVNFSTSSAVLPFSSSTPVDCVLHPHPVRRLVATNVSSTSFSVSWSSDALLTSHFRVLLFQGDQNLSDVRTGNLNFTAWGLKPGTLYTIKVLTEGCGQESKETQLMLRTAVQILEGRARIINANYTPGFSNSSTEEYQNFTQLYIADVYNSLPPHILRLVNAGQIKMVITNLTIGSVVAHFHLLIDKSLNSMDVSSAFFSALGNTSRFLINSSDLSIHDYNECENHVDDCCLHATCTNTYGFYNCSCNDGFKDLSLNWPGRACEATQNSTIPPQAVSPEDRPSPTFGTTLGTTFRPEVTMARASSTLTRAMSLKDAARVNCEIKYIVITMDKIFLKQKSIPESSLYLGQPKCNVSASNETHVELRAGWTECGTQVQSNRTHTMVNSTLRNKVLSQKPVQNIQLISPIRCLFPNDVLASSGYTPEGLYTIIEDLQGDGSFQPQFQLFDGENPIPKNSTLSPSDEVRIQVQITTDDSQFKVVLTECWATPTSNSLDPVSFVFINGSCALPNTFTSMVENGVSHKAQFMTKIFAFVNTSVVYLHCKLHVCLEASGKTCMTSCSGFRSLMSSDMYVTRRTSWGPLCQRDSDYHLKSTKDQYLAPGYIALIVIAVCVFVAGVTALVACHRRRKTGKYDFKLKSDNVGYQVFYN
nr:uromodulin-like 1 isoform X2 [Geotrypetes seraphini]